MKYMDVSLKDKVTVKNLIRSVEDLIKKNPNLARTMTVQLPVKTVDQGGQAPKKYGKAFTLTELKANL